MVYNVNATCDVIGNNAAVTAVKSKFRIDSIIRSPIDIDQIATTLYSLVTLLFLIVGPSYFKTTCFLDKFVNYE